MIKRIEVPSDAPVCRGCVYFGDNLNLSAWCKAPAGTPQCVDYDTDGRLADYIFVEDGDGTAASSI
jgi:hypothetical protein